MEGGARLHTTALETINELIEIGVLKPVWAVKSVTIYAVDYFTVYKFPREIRKRIEEVVPFRDRYARKYKRSANIASIDELDRCGVASPELAFAIIFSTCELGESEHVKRRNLPWRYGVAYTVRGVKGVEELAELAEGRDTILILVLSVYRMRLRTTAFKLASYGFIPASMSRVQVYTRTFKSLTRFVEACVYLTNNFANIYHAENPEIASRVASFLKCLEV